MRAGRGGVTWPAVPNTEYSQCSVTDSEADTERERLLSAAKVTEREREAWRGRAARDTGEWRTGQTEKMRKQGKSLALQHSRGGARLDKRNVNHRPFVTL